MIWILLAVLAVVGLANILMPPKWERSKCNCSTCQRFNQHPATAAQPFAVRQSKAARRAAQLQREIDELTVPMIYRRTGK